MRTKVLNNDFDFKKKKIKDDSMIINLFGIDSPGLTSSIQRGKYISKVQQSNIFLWDFDYILYVKKLRIVRSENFKTNKITIIWKVKIA